jgi:hypothetical protein
VPDRPPTRIRRRQFRAPLAHSVEEIIEDCAPPGSVPSPEYIMPEPWLEAQALVRGIYAIACGKADERAISNRLTNLPVS